jgi:hypothetical protein
LAKRDAARDRIRRARAQGRLKNEATVFVRGGVYPCRQTLRFQQEDSGTPEAPVTYRAYEGESPRFIGGRRITGFNPVGNSAIRDRLPEEARDHVQVVNLRDHGVTDFGKLSPRGFGGSGQAALELFYNGDPMPLARWPNQGWMTIESLPDGQEGSRLGYAGDRPARWTNAEDPWLFGYWYHGWADQYLPVESVDSENRFLTLGERHNYGFRAQQRFYALNLLEELDRPGEWYLNRESGNLYFWPPSPLEKAEAIVSVMQEPMVVLENVSHLNLEGLQFESTRDTGIVIRNGRDVTIADCNVLNVGADAIRVTGGRGHRIVGCDIANPGESGITLRGGDRQSLTPAKHEAVNNHIQHFSRWERTYHPALSLSGVGMRAAHNLIHHAPHMAIGFGGNNHLIEYNEIHHVLLETDDAGAMYIGRDWTERGHVIRYNYLHHSGPQYAAVAPPEQQTDPNVVYDLQRRLDETRIYEWHEVEAFARAFFDPKSDNASLTYYCTPARDRFKARHQQIADRVRHWQGRKREAEEAGDREGIQRAEHEIRDAGEARDELQLFRKNLQSFVRVYEFLSQVIDYDDTELEQLCVFARNLHPLLRT